MCVPAGYQSVYLAILVLSHDHGAQYNCGVIIIHIYTLPLVGFLVERSKTLSSLSLSLFLALVLVSGRTIVFLSQ